MTFRVGQPSTDVSLASAMADALRRRGVAEPAASLTAEAGVAVFKVSFARWTDETNQRDLSQLIRESLDELNAVTAGKPSPATRRARSSREPK
jgi:hypothetical protein